MVQHYYRNAHAIVVVYDVTNKSSFDSLAHWIDECDKHCFSDIPRILVGNKCDEEPVVNTNLAQRFADQYDMPVIKHFINILKLSLMKRQINNDNCNLSSPNSNFYTHFIEIYLEFLM